MTRAFARIMREVNFIRWMEASGYDVSYTTDVDTHANGSVLLNYKGILSMGHDEYWSKPMYDATVSLAMPVSIWFLWC